MSTHLACMLLCYFLILISRLYVCELKTNCITTKYLKVLMQEMLVTECSLSIVVLIVDVSKQADSVCEYCRLLYLQPFCELWSLKFVIVILDFTVCKTFFLDVCSFSCC